VEIITIIVGDYLIIIKVIKVVAYLEVPPIIITVEVDSSAVLMFFSHFPFLIFQ